MRNGRLSILTMAIAAAVTSGELRAVPSAPTRLPSGVWADETHRHAMVNSGRDVANAPRRTQPNAHLHSSRVLGHRPTNRRIPAAIVRTSLSTVPPAFTRAGQTVLVAASAVVVMGIVVIEMRRRRPVRFLVESERKYRTLFESATAGVFLESDVIEDCNDQACRLLGRRREDIIGHRPEDFSPPMQPDGRSSKEAAGQFIQAALAGMPQFFEWRCLRPDGTLVDFEVSLKAVRVGSRDLLVTTVYDITERKRAEVERLRFGHILEESLNEIYLFDAQSLRFVEVNRGARENLGYTMEELRRLTPLDLKPEFTAESFARLVEPLRSGKQRRIRFITEHRRKDGSTYPVEVHLQLSRQATPALFVAIILDITERKQAEEERLKLAGQLHTSQKMQAVGQLAGGVAHDFNNLLTVIFGCAEMLRERLRRQPPDAAALLVDLRQIEESAEKAAALTRQLLAFSRGQLTRPQLLNASDRLARMETLLRRLIRDDIELILECAPDTAPVHIDPGQFEQVILNLVVNARDAMPDGGTITLRTETVPPQQGHGADAGADKGGPFTVISVTDTGCGMEEATLERIFEPLFSTKPLGAGTGLGLATVKGIVEQAGGRVVVHSQPGRGTTFKVFLPATPDAQPAVVSKPPPTEETFAGKETILVCEDEYLVRRVTVMALEDRGYTVLEADGPKQALDIAAQHESPIDLLITDVIMRGMNGRQLARAIGEVRGPMKVLYMSGYTSDVIGRHGMLDENVHFLEKPFTLTHLAARVREVLDQSTVEPERISG